MKAKLVFLSDYESYSDDDGYWLLNGIKLKVVL